MEEPEHVKPPPKLGWIRYFLQQYICSAEGDAAVLDRPYMSSYYCNMIKCHPSQQESFYHAGPCHPDMSLPTVSRGKIRP